MANELERVAEILLKEAIKLKGKVSLSDENQIKPIPRPRAKQKAAIDNPAVSPPKR